MHFFNKKIELWGSRWHKFTRRPLKNLFKTSFKKKALISHITYPFYNRFGDHINYAECWLIAKCLNDLGYVVDVCDDKHPSNPSSYDVILSTGNLYTKYHQNIKEDSTKILYAPGMYPFHQNEASLSRAIDIYARRGSWLIGSCRIAELTNAIGYGYCDAIISVGNDFCAESHSVHSNKEAYPIPAPYRSSSIARNVIKERDANSKNNFLWIGGTGKVHKGLDLCLEVFSQRRDINLFIMGNFVNEEPFLEEYKKELASPNIKNLGFVKYDSEIFRNTLTKVSAIIYPTCSEGGSPSIISAIGNGALVSITTKNASVTLPNNINIKSFTTTAVEESIDHYLSFNWKQIKQMQKENLNFVEDNHSIEKFRQQMKSIIRKIILNDEK